MSTETKTKRVKKVFNRFDEITHLWANQTQEEARCRNGFFEGEIIYSFGRHFPIARIYTDKKGNKTVFFTTKGYSSTTSKHIYSTWNACNHLPVLHMHTVINNSVTFGELDYYHRQNISAFIVDIKSSINRFKSARENKKYIVRELSSFVKRFDDYVTFFELNSKIDSDTKSLIVVAKSDKWQKEIEEYEKKKAQRLADPKLQEKREKARKYREEKEFKLNAEQIEKWRNFEAYQPYLRKGRGYSYNNAFIRAFTLLRYNVKEERIETSKGVKIPIELAHRLYRYIKVVLQKGNCINAETCQYKILDYTVNEITHEYIRVGCHTIKQTEIELMATKMNWNNDQ